MEIEKLREQWLGHEFDTTVFEVRDQEVLDYARACGETDPRFCDPSHADFQTPPNYPTRLVGGRLFPADFPRIGQGGFDAGKRVECLGPIRVGDKLSGKSLLHDIYEKTGRSGTMIFIVHRMEFRNQREELVSIVDWRLVMRKGEKKE